MRSQPTYSTIVDASAPSGSENKRPARCYYCFMVVLFLMLFLVSVISLGSFGVIQAKVSNLWPIRAQSCILFASSPGSKPDKIYIDLSRISICAFVLWGQVSVTIVVFVWLIYNSVLFCLGTKL